MAEKFTIIRTKIDADGTTHDGVIGNTEGVNKTNHAISKATQHKNVIAKDELEDGTKMVKSMDPETGLYEEVWTLPTDEYQRINPATPGSIPQ